MAALSALPVLASELSKSPSHKMGDKTAPAARSEEKIEILPERAVANRITRLPQETRLEKYQSALESARKLREGQELKRAESTLIQLLESGAGDEIKRPALLELGFVMQEQKEFPKAQQLYTDYIRRYENDPATSEVLLRQAYLYREMGVPVMAMSKFYAVISTCLSLKLAEVEIYQRLVLRAQAEIAETHFLQGNYKDAIDYLNRLLKLESVDLERAKVLYKLVQCHSKLNSLEAVVSAARLFLEKHPNHVDGAETRFLLAEALKKLERNQDALAETEQLLRGQFDESKGDPQKWLYWQQKAGNTIANQFYREGDYVTALHVYGLLAEINPIAEWQIPVWYQIGLIYEHLQQPQKAAETYEKIGARASEVKGPPPGLKAVAEMAAWRKRNLAWEETARQANRRVTESAKLTPPDELADVSN